ncbi:glycoside hydrolase family 13 protein [Luteirhabdus pelagi]|uniref:glycoside hydrolase family 13 protein n=1 Tax=Luteirhabdus pelagi TaxID=2792783 RepID=UPI00193A7630|nr:glycoside hydrolase family 13 protein [Luteirhabdus pelagi]
MKQLSFLVFLFSFSLFAQLERVEPPFWWSDMHTSQIDILLYGENISTYEVSIDGMPISEVKKVENPNYLFVTVETNGLDAGTYPIQLTKKGASTVNYEYELKARKQNSATREGFSSSDAIYLLMPDRFANGNPNNDSTDDTVEKVNRSFDGGRHGGDIQGIINHLDYIDNLGFTAIWSTPLLEDNEPVYSYHTYAQSDYYKIDPRYGTNEDYARLAAEMRKRDMHLIMDYVTNHWGSKHWMIEDLPMKDWIHYWPEGENGFKRSNYRMTTQFDPNASEIDAEGCMEGWFDTTMPDMNQENPLLLQYMIQNAIWWIEYADLGGFRVDTYSYNDKEPIAKWTKAIMDEYPNFTIIGEVWMHDQAQISYWQGDSKIGALQGFNSHLPAVMDFTLHDAINVMFTETEGWDKGMIRAYDNFANDFLYPDVNNLMVFASNHDTTRINDLYDGDFDVFKQIMTLVFTVRGIPQFYYGDEIGMMGNKEEKGDGDIRRDFPGGWPGDTQNAFTEAGRNETQQQYHNLVSTILNWRKENAAIHAGETLQYIPMDQVYVYFRYTDADRVMVVLNNSEEDKNIELSRFVEGLNGAKNGTEIISGEAWNYTDAMTVPARAAMIIDLN